GGSSAASSDCRWKTNYSNVGLFSFTPSTSYAGGSPQDSAGCALCVQQRLSMGWQCKESVPCQKAPQFCGYRCVFRQMTFWKCPLCTDHAYARAHPGPYVCDGDCLTVDEVRFHAVWLALCEVWPGPAVVDARADPGGPVPPEYWDNPQDPFWNVFFEGRD
ncbi:TPA_asm: hypothetical protein, partial [Leatherback sea turtle adomavirus]